jgi:hypothetical protein
MRRVQADMVSRTPQPATAWHSGAAPQTRHRLHVQYAYQIDRLPMMPFSIDLYLNLMDRTSKENG